MKKLKSLKELNTKIYQPKKRGKIGFCGVKVIKHDWIYLEIGERNFNFLTVTDILNTNDAPENCENNFRA